MVSTAQYIGTPTTTAGDYLLDGDAYYPIDPQQHSGYGVVQGGSGGGHDFFSASGAPQGDWLIATGDATAFVGVGNGDGYFYGCDEDGGMPRTTRT